MTDSVSLYCQHMYMQTHTLIYINLCVCVCLCHKEDVCGRHAWEDHSMLEENKGGESSGADRRGQSGHLDTSGSRLLKYFSARASPASRVSN